MLHTRFHAKTLLVQREMYEAEHDSWGKGEPYNSNTYLDEWINISTGVEGGGGVLRLSIGLE